MTNKHLNDWSRKELMALPVRQRFEEKEYDSLLLVSTRKKHPSGWAIIAVIGVRDGVPEEIACNCCDLIRWNIPAQKPLNWQQLGSGQLHTDCVLRSGAMHAWHREGRFKVGAALSSISITVELIPNT